MANLAGSAQRLSAPGSSARSASTSWRRSTMKARKRALLMHTTPRSLILVEDLDRYLLQGHGGDKGEDAEARVLGFMDERGRAY